MERLKKGIASVAIAAMSLTLIPLNVFAAGAFPTRISGNNAAQTAVQIAEQTNWTGIAILASSTTYGMVDALTVGPLATFLHAPILLTEAGDHLNIDTQAELTKLKVTTLFVTSGTGVISQAVLDQLTGMGITIVPLGGVDRFATAANIANKMVLYGANVSKVAVAYGWKNQDALSIAAIASAQSEPILLTEKDTIPSSVQEFLTTNPIVKATDVIGGTGVVSDSALAQLPSATRHYGNTAYDTNLAVLKAFDSVLKYDHVFIANGETAIDALAGATLAAKYKAGIVLINGVANKGTVYVGTKLSDTSVVTAIGGTAVVPEAVRKGIADAAPPAAAGGGGGGVAFPVPIPVPVPVPVTPAAPTVAADDTANSVSGMSVGMEYDLDNAGYVAYNAITFSGINLSGTHTLLVRIAAAGINPPSPMTTITFTTNPVTQWPVEVENVTIFVEAITGLTFVNIDILNTYANHVNQVSVDGQLANKITINQWRIEILAGTTLANLQGKLSVNLFANSIDSATASSILFGQTYVLVALKPGITATSVKANTVDLTLNSSTGEWVGMFNNLPIGSLVEIIVDSSSGIDQITVPVTQL